LLIHESSHNLQTVSKSPKLTSSWLPIFKCEIIRHTKIQNPSTKIQFPQKLKSYASLKTRLKSWTNTKSNWFCKLQCQNGQNANKNSLKKKYEKKVVYNSKLYHILIWCVQLFFARPIKSSKTIR
jgi:hypothetical protein